MESLSSVALAGMRKASETINNSAKEISTGADPGNPEPFVKIKQAEVTFEANAAVLKTEKRLNDSILDILA